MKEITFTVSENSEPINALMALEIFINKLNDDLYNWKWVIISAHNCIQNLMVSSLSNGNNLNVLDDKTSKNWFIEFSKRMKSKIDEWKSPKEKLDYFLNLYSKIKSDKMLMFTISKKLESNAETDEAMEWLNWYRNKFIHFVPSTFQINVVHFPKRMLLIMEIMRFLVLKSGNILWLNIEDKEITEKLIATITELFSQLNENYTSE